MKEIPLHNRKDEIVAYALVDDHDFEQVSQWAWHASSPSGGTFYASSWINGKHLSMHRFILGITNGEIDHINLNKLDNQRHNLRLVTRTQNNMNQPKPSRRFTQSSQYKGVTFSKLTGKWVARIASHHVGIFALEIDAAKAYDRKAVELFGTHAYLNFPSEAAA